MFMADENVSLLKEDNAWITEDIMTHIISEWIRATKL